jgi:uncharacterized protein (DUF2141 family)
MKKIYTFMLACLAILVLSSFIKQKGETYSLTIEVKELQNSKGIVQFALYNKEGSIPDEDYKKCYKILKAEIANGSSTITFHDIPKGKYAVNILHDENSNGKIEKGFILPLEGIGFSNYQSIGLSNRPNFEKASFILNSNKVLMIRMVYL